MNDDASETPGRSTSRRTFLKTIGATALGTIATTLPLPSALVQAASPPLLDQAWSIAAVSPLLREALQGLHWHQFDFLLDKTSIVRSSALDQTVGLTLKQRSSPSRRTGSDIVLTVNAAARQVISVEYVVGWCLHTSFDVQSIVLMADGQQAQQSWSLARSEVVPMHPDEFVTEGWPPDNPERCYWYYLGSEQGYWADLGGSLIYRCRQVVEHRSCEPSNRRTLNLEPPAS